MSKAPHQGLRIEQMFAFCCVDEADQVEGLVGYRTRHGWMPMVGADMEKVEQLRPMAQAAATANGRSITLCVFTQREDREVISP